MEKTTIKINFEKFNQIIFQIFKTDPYIKYDVIWQDIGLNRVDKFKNNGIYFEILDKNKLIHGMIKYGFTI